MEPNREAAAFIAIAAVGVVYWWWVRRNMPSRKCDECDQTESDTRVEQSRAELVAKEPKIAAIEAAAVKAFNTHRVALRESLGAERNVMPARMHKALADREAKAKVVLEEAIRLVESTSGAVLRGPLATAPTPQIISALAKEAGVKRAEARMALINAGNVYEEAREALVPLPTQRGPRPTQ